MIADPALYIAERVIFTTMGSTAQITAAIYSSNPNILTIKWYLANTLIDIDSNPRYSVTQNESFFYTLNVMNVDESVLGWYRIIVTGGGRNETGSVQLSYLCELVYLCIFLSLVGVEIGLSPTTVLPGLRIFKPFPGLQIDIISAHNLTEFSSQLTSSSLPAE